MTRFTVLITLIIVFTTIITLSDCSGQQSRHLYCGPGQENEPPTQQFIDPALLMRSASTTRFHRSPSQSRSMYRPFAEGKRFNSVAQQGPLTGSQGNALSVTCGIGGCPTTFSSHESLQTHFAQWHPGTTMSQWASLLQYDDKPTPAPYHAASPAFTSRSDVPTSPTLPPYSSHGFNGHTPALTDRADVNERRVQPLKSGQLFHTIRRPSSRGNMSNPPINNYPEPSVENVNRPPNDTVAARRNSITGRPQPTSLERQMSGTVTPSRRSMSRTPAVAECPSKRHSTSVAADSHTSEDRKIVSGSFEAELLHIRINPGRSCEVNGCTDGLLHSVVDFINHTIQAHQDDFISGTKYALVCLYCYRTGIYWAIPPRTPKLIYEKAAILHEQTTHAAHRTSTEEAALPRQCPYYRKDNVECSLFLNHNHARHYGTSLHMSWTNMSVRKLQSAFELDFPQIRPKEDGTYRCPNKSDVCDRIFGDIHELRTHFNDSHY